MQSALKQCVRTMSVKGPRACGRPAAVRAPSRARLLTLLGPRQSRCGPAALAGFPQRRQAVAALHLGDHSSVLLLGRSFLLRGLLLRCVGADPGQRPLRIGGLLRVDATGRVALEVDHARRRASSPAGSRRCGCSSRAGRSGARARRAPRRGHYGCRASTASAAPETRQRVRETGGKEGDNLIELHGGEHCFTNRVAHMRRAGAMILNCWRCR